MDLIAIVEQLKTGGYTCQAGPLELSAAFQELEKLANCEHLNSIDVVEFEFDKYWKQTHRKYYVQVCPDCGMLLNDGEIMNPDEQLQMFADLNKHLDNKISEIESTASDLRDIHKGFITEVPKA